MTLKDFCKETNCKFYSKKSEETDDYSCLLVGTRGFLELDSYILKASGTPADKDIISELKVKCIHYNVMKQLVAVEKL